jgi:ATP-binding cassette subfamily F protein uup
MAMPPIITLRDVRISFGGEPVFENLSLSIGPGEHACLVGRNGSGKSTLLKTLAGLIEIDAGERFVQPGTRIAYLPQDPVPEPERTVADYVALGAVAGDPGDAPAPHQVDAILQRIDLDGALRMATLSGGEARRAAIARALASEPDVLLMDEPTNHLDLPMIEWLEHSFNSFAGAILLVSHDRTFLNNIARQVVWLDRGRLRQTERGFAVFDDWVEEILTQEEKELSRLDKRIAAETRWLHRGVTARRRRNQGRLQRLQQMRAARSTLLGGPVHAKLTVQDSDIKSRLVIEARQISKSFEAEDGTEIPIVGGFSTRILRGDRIGVIGPNGSGKTTLLRLLTGDLKPDGGLIRLAKTLRPAYFDQQRAALDLALTPWETLCPEGGDTVWLQGKPRHVVGYLKNFLFDPDQTKSPVSTLSGGERNRLMLAKVLTQPSDLLVLDEPTNDLDMDTLDLLEDMLGEYGGTLLLVSHDRDFLDRIVTSVIALEGEGSAKEYAGGYADYLRQCRPDTAREAKTEARADKQAEAAAKPRPKTRTRLGYKDTRALEMLPKRIDALDAEILTLEQQLADPDLYAKDPTAFDTAAARLEAAQMEHEQAETRWLELELLREELAEVDTR